MPIMMKTDFEKAYADFKKVEQPRDIVMFYHKNLWSQSNGKNGFSTANNDEFKPQMKIWKKFIKKGLIKCVEHNNVSKKADDGREWHLLTIQEAGKDNHDIDGMGLFIFGYMVGGSVYAFQKKQNRDAVFKYINS